MLGQLLPQLYRTTWERKPARWKHHQVGPENVGLQVMAIKRGPQTVCGKSLWRNKPAGSSAAGPATPCLGLLLPCALGFCHLLAMDHSSTRSQGGQREHLLNPPNNVWATASAQVLVITIHIFDIMDELGQGNTVWNFQSCRAEEHWWRVSSRKVPWGHVSEQKSSR